MNVLSVRYSVNRKEQFQIKTSIVQNEGVKYVVKEAITKDGIQHIDSVYKNQFLLETLDLPIVKCEKVDDKIIFPFIEGINFGTLLGEIVKNKDKKHLLEQLFEFKKMLFNTHLTYFEITNEFRDIFGDFSELEGVPSIKIANIDLNFENIIIDKNNLNNIIDYEWVFNFSIPAEFILYRSIKLFINRYYYDLKKIISSEEIFEKLQIRNENLMIYEIMEANFQRYVSGGWIDINKSYLKKNLCEKEILKEIVKNNETMPSIQILNEDKVIFNGNFDIKNNESKLSIEFNDIQLSKFKVKLDKIEALLEIKVLNQDMECQQVGNVHIEGGAYLIDKTLKGTNFLMIGQTPVFEIEIPEIKNPILEIYYFKDTKIYSELIGIINENKEIQNELMNNLKNSTNDILSLGENLDDIIHEYKSNQCQIDKESLESNDFENLIESKMLNTQKPKQEINQRLKYLNDLINHKKTTTDILEKEYMVLKNQNEGLENEKHKLLDKERTLNSILDSDGWKMLSRYYRIRDKVFKPNGKIRFFAKMAKRVVIDRNFKMINKENIKKFRRYYKNQDLSMLENRVDNYIERNTSTDKPIELDIEEITNYEKLVFTKFEKPKVSIIIPVYNQWHYTYSCLKSILNQTFDVTYEIILADDMSSDETVNVGEYVENIKVVRDGENRGFLLNCNNAAQYADGEYIYFLNNDTQVQESWLTVLVELIENDSSIGMVGSKLVYPDGRMQEAGGIIWNDASGWNYGRLDDPNKAEYNYVKEVDYISGAAIMIRSSLWKAIGGFDKRYVPAYYEDTDLAFEVRKHGFKVVLNPKSVIVHFEGISHGKDENSKAQEYQKKNKDLFLNKWNKELTKFHFENGENVFVARDRSRNKKTIVVVDHYVPHFDKDAGSRCTYLYLNLFVKLGYKVVFIGDNFYKHEPYTSDLQARGIEVIYGNEYAQNIKKWFKDNSEYIDYVYLNRPHISIKYIDMLKKNTQAKIIYFGHDLHYLRELRNYEIEKNPDLLKSSKQWKELEFELFNKTDVIHVVGSYEQEVLQKELGNKPIRNIPLFMFSNDEYKKLELDFNERKDILFVGGFNHKPNYDGVWWFINEVFPGIKEKNPDIKFYIVGSNPPEDIKKLHSESIIVTGYVTDDQLDRYYKQCRIVVVPLRYGAGVKGKVVEALYHQVPIVTTQIGAEGLAKIEDTVLIANSNEEFALMTSSLYNDENKWNELAINSEQYIKDYFSIEAAINQVELDIR